MFELHGFGDQLLLGVGMTLKVAAGGLLLGLVLGLLGAAAKLSRARPLYWLGATYTTLMRGLPELLVVLVLVGIAADRYGEWGLLHALARIERADADVFPVL